MADFGVSEGCSVDAIHASWVGGITVGKHGAFSVALSGGYEDDVDLGYAL
jgi:E3 ubiquitin-protein ligase UHRF1